MGVFLHYLCISFFFFKSVSPKLSLFISKILFEFESNNISILSFISPHFTQYILCYLILFCSGSSFLHICFFCQASSPFSYLCFLSIHRLSNTDPISALLQNCLCYTWIPGTSSQLKLLKITSCTECQLEKAYLLVCLLIGVTCKTFGFPIIFLENTDVITRGTKE